MCLWAGALEVPHPTTGHPLRVELPESARFEKLREQQARRWAKFHEGTGGASSGDDGEGAYEGQPAGPQHDGLEGGGLAACGRSSSSGGSDGWDADGGDDELSRVGGMCLQ
jgi:hypothetical protein